MIDIAAATLGLCAGVFFCLGVLKIEDATLETIATSMWEKGKTISKELALQKVDFKFGAIYLAGSFLVQLAGKCIPSEVAHSIVATSTLFGALAGLGVPLVLVVLLLVPYFHLRAKAIRRLSEAIVEKV